jgi:hypothetical protein
MMRAIYLAALLVVSFGGTIKAQEMTGAKAEEVKKEIVKLEEDKVPIIMKGGPAAVEWFDNLDADDIAYLSGSRGERTKADILDEWRSGVRTMLNTRHYDFHVRVYDNGNTAVVTYRASGTSQFKGKAARNYHEMGSEVLVKQNGKWRAVAHAVVDVPQNGSSQ